MGEINPYASPKSSKPPPGEKWEWPDVFSTILELSMLGGFLTTGAGIAIEIGFNVPPVQDLRPTIKGMFYFCYVLVCFYVVLRVWYLRRRFKGE